VNKRRRIGKVNWQNEKEYLSTNFTDKKEKWYDIKKIHVWNKCADSETSAKLMDRFYRNAYIAFPLRMFKFYSRTQQHFLIVQLKRFRKYLQYLLTTFVRVSYILLTPLPYQILFCSIWGSHSGGYEAFYLLGYNAVYSDENNPKFRRRMSPPSSGSNKPSNKPA
jgi:hypothetical protein